MKKILIAVLLVTSLSVWADDASKQARAEKKAAREAAREEKLEGEGTFYTNGRMDHVTLETMREKVAKERAPQHPVTISIDQMKDYLLSVMVSEKDLMKKSPEVVQVFNERAVGFLAPILVKAFSKVRPDQMVALSWLTKDPNFVLRNDRIIIAEMWVKDDQLHMKFNKLLAMLVGDTDKKGNFNYVINQSRSLRTKLITSSVLTVTGKNGDEAVIAMNGDFSAMTTPDTVAGGQAADAKSKERSIKARLSDLEQLRKDKMITEAEYQAKRKQLLDSL